MLTISERFFLFFVFFILVSFFLVSKLTSFRKWNERGLCKSAEGIASFCSPKNEKFFEDGGRIVRSTSQKEKKKLLLNEERNDQILSVELSGAVYRPGRYTLFRGEPLSVVLQKARLKPLADLSSAQKEQSIEESCELCIPFLKKISIEIDGEIEEKAQLTLPAGSRVCDLKPLLSLKKNAESSFFKSKRLLKDRERIEIPSQKK